MISRFIQTLSSAGELNEADLQMVAPRIRKEAFKKGAYYLKAGRLSDRISWIEEGLLRLFYKVDGEEKTMLFFREGQFVSDYFSFLTDTPSIRPIQALEDSTVISLSKSDLQSLFDQSKNWERIGRKLAEQAYLYSVQRANRLLHDDYDTRFLAFQREHPSLLQRIPQYMIASYLHMTPETLSRVKRRVMNRTEGEPPSIHDPYEQP